MTDAEVESSLARSLRDCAERPAREFWERCYLSIMENVPTGEESAALEADAMLNEWRKRFDPPKVDPIPIPMITECQLCGWSEPAGVMAELWMKPPPTTCPRCNSDPAQANAWKAVDRSAEAVRELSKEKS